MGFRTRIKKLISCSSASFSTHTLFKLINGAFFFKKSFYTKVALKNHIDTFLKKNIANT
jgi:hypothetical protein